MAPLLQIAAGELQLFGILSLQLHLAVLVFLLVIAVAVDIREHRIPNWLVAAGMIVATLFHAGAPQGMGTWFALSGLGVGIVTLFPLFALGLMGAGDVKLMGMIGAFLGVSGVLGALLASLAAGGVLALGMAANKRMLPQLLANLRLILVQRHIRQAGGSVTSALPTPPSVGKMPYAVAICAGTLVQLFVLSH
jgi:prepilin peptidase CpaA